MKYDLSIYDKHLSSHKLVREHEIPYMNGWVRHYLLLGKPIEADFANILAEEEREDWQIRQALNAVQIFKQVFPEKATVLCEDIKEPLEDLRRSLKIRHYSRATQKIYTGWSSRYVKYCNENSIDEKLNSSFKNYLSYLALNKKVAASTQNQAFNAILFLFRKFFLIEPENIDAVRAKKPVRMPLVLSMDEVSVVLRETGGVTGLIIQLIYSSGLRLSEALRLRIQDMNLIDNTLVVRGGKGDKDRVTIFSYKLIPLLKKQISLSRSLSDNRHCAVAPHGRDRILTDLRRIAPLFDNNR